MLSPTALEEVIEWVLTNKSLFEVSIVSGEEWMRKYMSLEMNFWQMPLDSRCFRDAMRPGIN